MPIHYASVKGIYSIVALLLEFTEKKDGVDGVL